MIERVMPAEADVHNRRTQAERTKTLDVIHKVSENSLDLYNFFPQLR